MAPLLLDSFRQLYSQAVQDALRQSGFEVAAKSFYNYSLGHDWGTLPALVFPHCREVMMFRCRKAAIPHG